MKKITKRDVIVFILGFMTFFLIETIFNWQNAKDSFKRGYDAARSEVDK
jgi:hypothetical protein